MGILQNHGARKSPTEDRDPLERGERKAPPRIDEGRCPCTGQSRQVAVARIMEGSSSQERCRVGQVAHYLGKDIESGPLASRA